MEDEGEIGAGVGCDCRSDDAVECLALWIKDLPHANPAIATDGACHCDCHESLQRLRVGIDTLKG